MKRKLVERRRRFGAALAVALRAAGKTRAELGDHVGMTESGVSYWVNGEREPRLPDVVFATERFLGTPPGHLSQHLGYLPSEALELKTWSVEEALHASSDLTPENKERLLDYYRVLVDWQAGQDQI